MIFSQCPPLATAEKDAAICHAHWPRGVLLVIAVLLTACGTGISLDPTEFEPPNTVDPGGDGGQTEAGDASPPDDVAGARGDASVGEDSADSDSRSDRSELPDRTGENDATDGSEDQSGDAGRDGSDDGSEDRSADAGIDRDASMDVGIDRSTDAGVDRDAAGADSDAAGADRDAPGAHSDAGDVSSESSDAPKDSEREVVTADTIDGCNVDCGKPEFDYYVDANAAPGGDGSKEAPFRTISAAIEAHVQAPSQARKAYVAAGTYDEALGEIFPLVLRGLSLEGAGRDKTFIVGSGTLDHAGQGGPKNRQYMVTIVAGDRVLETKVARLSLRPLAPVPVQGYYGLFCDRGNATGEVASPAGQTHVDEINVGPGYDTSVLVVASTIPVVTGCNMLMTRSTATGGWNGVEAQGCNDLGGGPAMLQMGTDDPTSGNTVTWMQSVSIGTAIYAGSCVVSASFQYNTISDCNNGLTIDDHFPPTPASVLSEYGQAQHVHTYGVHGIRHRRRRHFVEEVSDNRFFDTTQTPASTVLGIAMRIWMPVVGKVRRNVFVGNDIGLVLDQGAEQTDVGRPGDPGGNVFSCNSGVDGLPGADVVVLYPPPRGSGGVKSIRGLRFVRDANGGDGGDDGGDGGAHGLDGGDGSPR